ncbi:hypothetical protein CBR_g26012 [Chara braunii]|uniref:Reverse transcriptase domain-containing protein n=1 Tax=Chara braunii TaxID=69332 RepID=A0A388L6Z7_CHABU|nr:hypothetical protein CBR_g26012 [Chara braunii]|eukprot:GBG78075.1 hypothetical protein CBR_g26012 [Chara braunii]
MQGPGQTQWVPKTAIAAPKPFTGDKRGEDLDTWLRAVPIYVKCKLTLPHEEVLVAASYLEGSAARWLSRLLQLQGYGYDFRAWAVTQQLDDVLKLVEERWHDPQEAQKATNAILTLHTRQFKSVREATDAVEHLICVPGVHYDPQVLLTSYLRCFPMPLRNQLAGEANINVHNFPSFSKKALDLEAKIRHGQAPTTDGRRKMLPPNWKAKGHIMFVNNDGSTIELDDNFQEGVGSETGSVEASGDGVVVAVAQKGKATGRRRGGSRSRSQVDPNAPPWEKAGLTEDVWRDRYGLYEFVVMPFGLCNAPSTFQHTMNQIFHDCLDKFVIVYLDDILIFSKTVEEEHVAHLDKVLNLLRQHKFKINGEKCEFGRTRVLYLGHEISAEGLKPDDAKVANIRDWPRPQSVTEMRSFLGMTGYFRNFVKNYSIVAAPLTDLTRLDTSWEWTDICEAAFRHLKHALTHHEVLKLPDPDKPFVVTTDASQYGIGAWMRTQPVLSDALKRWIEVIEQYDFEPQYIKGEYNKVADALSRRPDFSGPLITEFGLMDDVTRSLVEAYREDQFMYEIIRKLEAKDVNTFVEFELVNDLLFLEKAVEQMQKAQAAMIESENKHHRPSTFQVGDRVWVKSSKLGQEHGISHKLMPQYFGPWEVLDIVGTDPDGPSYVLRILGHLRTYPVFHASKLAPFRETEQFPSRRSMLPPTMDGEVDIDDIVDHRELPVPRPTGRGRPPKPKLQYRVRFRHHTDPKEDGWFTMEELMQTAPQVVAHYERSLQKGKRPMIED